MLYPILSKRFIVLLSFVAFVVAMRVVPVWIGGDLAIQLAGYSPLAALALFSGVYFRSYHTFVIYFVAHLVSDVLLSQIYPGEWHILAGKLYWVYGSTYIAFAMILIVARYMKPNKSGVRFLNSTLIAVMIHWLVTDFGVWLQGTVYPMTLEGFYTCLVMAIPFEFKFLAATLIYGGILFLQFEWLKQRHPALCRVTSDNSV